MLTGVVLASREGERIQKALASIQFADQVLVITDNPSPETLGAIKSMGMKYINHPLNGDFAAQRNFALKKVNTPWVLFVDGDEQVSPELAKKISQAIKTQKHSGYLLHRVDQIWGHNFKHGDLGNVYLLRLGKKEAGKWTGKVHEVWQIPGPTPKLSGELMHHPHPDMASFLKRLNQYSDIRASELFSQKQSVSIADVVAYPFGKFLYLFVFKLGFLDRVPGLVHALTMSFYSFLVRGKLYLKARDSGI